MSPKPQFHNMNTAGLRSNTCHFESRSFETLVESRTMAFCIRMLLSLHQPKFKKVWMATICVLLKPAIYLRKTASYIINVILSTSCWKVFHNLSEVNDLFFLIFMHLLY